MRRTGKKMAALLLGFALICTITACTSGNGEAVGQWYNSREKCLDIRDDGSWKLEDSYGTGTWKKLSDGSFEFIDFYGDTQNTLISEDEWGKYIDFGYYGDFYKDEYPPEMGTEEDIEESMEEDTSEIEMNTPIEIDPFENLSYEVYGISPYCEITLNNSACSEEVQKYVTYTLDKETYANGETAVITAVLSEKTGEESYVLKSEETTYDISEQPEYISDLENVDLSALKQELSDVVEAEKAKASGGDLLFTLPHWEVGGTHFKSCDNIAACDVYFLSLKSVHHQKFDMQRTPYNQICFTYEVDYTWENSNSDEVGSGTFWVNVSAGNLIKYPDGSVKWGYESSDSYDFKYSYSQTGLEDCISTTVMSNSDFYNISKIEE